VTHFLLLSLVCFHLEFLIDFRLIDLENGPCMVTTETAVYNPYSWSNHSNMLYLSQPIGTGFSYSEEEPGSIDNAGDFVPASEAPITGRKFEMMTCMQIS